LDLFELAHAGRPVSLPRTIVVTATKSFFEGETLVNTTTVILALILIAAPMHASKFTSLGKHRALDLYLDSSIDIMNNASGGTQTGIGYNGLVSLGLDVDLTQVLGWKATSLRISGLQLYGSGMASRVGDLLGASGIEGYNSARLYESWLEKSFAEISLSLRAGLLLADEEFATMQVAGPFLNATFGWPEFISMNVVNTGPAFFVPALGARLLWAPDNNVYGTLGIFDGDTLDSPIGDDAVNSNGLHWELGNGQGAMIIGEIGFPLNGNLLPGLYKFGAWYHSAKFADLSGGADHIGNRGIYTSAEQMIYSQHADQGLSLFARAGFAPQDRSKIAQSFQVGLSYAGLIPNRNNDTLAIGLSHADITTDLIGRKAETVFEVAYEYVKRSDMTIQLSVQRIFNPGETSELDDALVLGLRGNFSF
jgi:porin